MGLCHRNLSLENVVLDEGTVKIARLGWALRIDKKKTNGDWQPPPPGNTNPQFIPPEFFKGKVSWDGFAYDLWAAGLMLYSMVVSSQALFAAPIPEDRLFTEICTKGNVGIQAEKFGKAIGREIKLSDSLIDLLQKMLKVDPRERLQLQDVMGHNWVKDGEEEIPPGLIMGRDS